MDVVFNILLFAHLVALVWGAATNVAMPVMARFLATPEGGPVFGQIGKVMSRNAHISIGVLIVTGVLMVWVRYGGVEGMSGWFWLKMTLVALLVVLMAVGRRLPPALFNPRYFGMAARVLLLSIVFSAVFAFN